MTGYTYDERIVSDLHKDTYGFRPVSGWWQEWKEADEDGKQAIWDMLLESLDQTQAYERMRQEAAVDEFEANIAAALQLGATDRSQAIGWIVDSLELSETDLMYGGERICYELGLPFHMASVFDPYL